MRALLSSLPRWLLLLLLSSSFTEMGAGGSGGDSSPELVELQGLLPILSLCSFTGGLCTSLFGSISLKNDNNQGDSNYTKKWLLCKWVLVAASAVKLNFAAEVGSSSSFYMGNSDRSQTQCYAHQ